MLYVLIWLYVFSHLEIFFIDFNLKVEEGELNFLDSLTSRLEDGCSSKSLEAKRRKSTICSGTILHHKFDLKPAGMLNTKREAYVSSVPDLEQGVALSNAAHQKHAVSPLPCFSLFEKCTSWLDQRLAVCKGWMHRELTPGATYLFNNCGTYESKFTLTYVSNITFKLSKSFWFCC